MWFVCLPASVQSAGVLDLIPVSLLPHFAALRAHLSLTAPLFSFALFPKCHDELPMSLRGTASELRINEGLDVAVQDQSLAPLLGIEDQDVLKVRATVIENRPDRMVLRAVCRVVLSVP